jgi:hypothetical protein
MLKRKLRVVNSDNPLVSGVRTDKALLRMFEARQTFNIGM